MGRWSPRSEAIVAAIVIGDRAGLDEEVQRRLQEAGTYHVIAISGGNIAILAGVLLGAFRFAGWLGRTAMVASIAALVLYADFVGGGASVDRATLMAVVYFTGRALDHRGAATNSLALVCALLVAARPAGGCRSGVRPDLRRDARDPRRCAGVGAAIDAGRARAATTQAGRATRRGGVRWTRSARATDARLAGCHIDGGGGVDVRGVSRGGSAAVPGRRAVFSRVTFAGLGLNFVAIPLMGVAQLAGMAVVPLAAVSWRLAAAAGWVAHLGAAGLVASANLVRFAQILTYRVAPPSSTAIALYYAAGVTAWWLWRRVDVAGRAVSPRMRASRLVATGAAVAAAAWILIDPGTFVAPPR